MKLKDHEFLARFRAYEDSYKEDDMDDPISFEEMPETAAEIAERIVEIDALIPITRDAIATWVTKTELLRRVSTLQEEREALVSRLIDVARRES